MGGININFFITIIIIIAVFLITREFWCWYFKINKVVGLLEKQLEEQKNNNALMLTLLKKESKKEISEIKNEKKGLED
jgi:hypothetical protein